MFVGLWRTIKITKQPLDRSLFDIGASDYPYTINYVIKKRIQIDSFMELPEEKRPPRNIWDKPSELDEWFNRVFDNGKDKKQTEFVFPVDEVEE